MMNYPPRRLLAIATTCVVAALWLARVEMVHAAPDPKVPGVIINYVPASSGIYIGSPSIAILPDGSYVASHDEFGPKSTEHKSAISHVYRSSDKGQSWSRIATINGAFWSSLFVHRGQLYLLGPEHHYGNVVIRRSTDGGRTWTEPKDAKSGLLAKGNFHCAPMPVIVHNGRIWRAMEDCAPLGRWGHHFKAMMMSVPEDANLLDSGNWTLSTRIARDASWLGGTFNGFLEGNAMVDPTGNIVDILRVDTPRDEYAAIVHISPDGKTASFDGEKDFVPFPGGAKKFTIRFDPKSKLYWSLSNYIPPRHASGGPGGTRNTLALICSSDLRKWDVRCVLIYHPERYKHGFQYVDWVFEGDDMLAACRTAFDDSEGGAHNFHDANYLTFHRVKNFRDLAMKDSVEMPDLKMPLVQHRTTEMEISGYFFEIAPFASGGQAFGNRQYAWQNVPQQFKGWSCTRTYGGENATIRVKAIQDMTLYATTSAGGQKAINMGGWKKIDAAGLHYDDKGKTAMNVFCRPIKAGEEMDIRQGNWTGLIVLIPPGQ